MTSKFCAALVFLFLAFPALAQLVSQPLDDGTIVTILAGQSFTAPSTTTITRISVRPEVNFTGTLDIYNGAAGSGVVGAVGAPVYSQAVTGLLATPSGGAMRDIVLTTPFPVTAGNTYTFHFSSGRWRLKSADPYAGGVLVIDYADVTNPSFDFAFQLWNDPLTPATVASIPTLSQWGLITMSGLLGLIGLMAVTRSRRGR